ALMMPTLALVSLMALSSTGEATFTPGPSEDGVPDRFRLPAATFRYELRRLREMPGYSVSALTFPSPIVSPDPANNVVHAEYFRPNRPGNRPAAVVLHILGADFALSR